MVLKTRKWIATVRLKDATEQRFLMLSSLQSRLTSNMTERTTDVQAASAGILSRFARHGWRRQPELRRSRALGC